MADDLNRDRAEKQFKGAARDAEGKIRNKIGDLADDRSEQIRGKADELRGKAERKIGELDSEPED